MQSKQYFTKIKNYPHEKSTEPKYALIHIHSIIIKKGLCLIETQPLYGIIYILFYFT